MNPRTLPRCAFRRLRCSGGTRTKDVRVPPANFLARLRRAQNGQTSDSSPFGAFGARLERRKSCAGRQTCSRAPYCVSCLLSLVPHNNNPQRQRAPTGRCTGTTMLVRVIRRCRKSIPGMSRTCARSGPSACKATCPLLQPLVAGEVRAEH